VLKEIALAADSSGADRRTSRADLLLPLAGVVVPILLRDICKRFVGNLFARRLFEKAVYPVDLVAFTALRWADFIAIALKYFSDAVLLQAANRQRQASKADIPLLLARPKFRFSSCQKVLNQCGVTPAFHLRAPRELSTFEKNYRRHDE